MQKTIKKGKDNGIADKVQGQIVEVIPHPKYEGMWQFNYGKDTWIASDYAFEEG